MKTNATVTIAEITGTDDYNKPTWGAQAQIDVWLEHNSRINRGKDGQVTEQKHQFMTEAVLDPQAEYLIWLPGADTSKIAEARRAEKVQKAQSLRTSKTGYYAAF